MGKQVRVWRGRMSSGPRCFAAVIIVLNLGLAGCPVLPPQSTPAATGPQAPQQGQSLNVGMNSISSLDPNKWNGSYDSGIGNQIYDALVTTASGEPHIRPWLAESWSLGSDQRTYTFKLKPGVRFHDGSPFNADAATQNFERLSVAARQSIVSDLASRLASVRAVDDLTLEVQLKSWWPGFLDALEFVPMLSPTAWKQWGDNYGQHPVGTGPFMLDEWVPEDHLTLKRNPDYAWPPDGATNRGPAYLDSVTVKLINDPPARLVSLESGDTQVITSVPLQDVARLEADSHFKVIKASSPGMPLTLYLNAAAGPLAEQQVRSAIEFALNRAELSQVAGYGQSIPATGLLSSSTRCFSTSLPDPFPHDPARARQLLDDDGWLVGADGVRSKDGVPLSFQVAIFADYANLASLMQAELADVGIQLTSMVSTSPALAPLVRSSQLSAWMVAQPVSADPSVLTKQLNSREIGNSPESAAIVRDPELDSLLDQGANEFDPGNQCALYTRSEQRFLGMATAYPIWELTLPLGMASNVEGVRLVGATGVTVPRFQEMYIDR